MNENTPVPPAEGADLPAENDEVLVERIRSADPAATLEPEGPALRTAVDQRIAAGRTDELALVRARRWTSWPVRVAGVAAAALVVGGGGGYAAGAAGDVTSPAAPAITLQSAPQGQGGAPGAGLEGLTAVAQSGSPEAQGASALGKGTADMSYSSGYWGGRTVFTSTGLSGEGGSARAWTFDPAQAFTEDAIARAAAGLGVAGAPVLVDGYWQAGPQDGTGPTATLSPDGTSSLSFYDPTKDPWFCLPQTDPAEPADPATSEAPATDGSTGDAGMVAPDACTQRDLGPAPQGDSAVAAARDALVAVGVDPAGYELSPESWGDEAWSSVSAFQLVDGQRSGVQWSFSFTGAGLLSVYGALAPVVELGEYVVISPKEAVERLTDPRFGNGWGGPMYVDGMYAERAVAADGGVASDQAVAPLPTLPPTMTAGNPLRWPVNEVTITGARLGVALQTQPDGAAVLVPTYELTASDGGVWSVVAVADSELDFSPAS